METVESKIKFGKWPKSKRLRSYIECTLCHRSQTVFTKEPGQGISLESANLVGWTEDSNGWKCPIHSDKGSKRLSAIFNKRKAVRKEKCTK